MAYTVIKANDSHYQYFKKEVIDQGAGYIVSNANSIIGLFSFMIEGTKATLSFTYVYDLKAIQEAIEAFLKDYEEVKRILYTGNQNLSKIGFNQKIYDRK